MDRQRPLIPRSESTARAAAALLLALATAACTSTYAGRWIFWNFSSITDHELFPAEPMSAGGGEVFHFARVERAPVIEVEIERRGRTERVALDELGRRTHTTALLVIHRDALLFEGYFNGYARESINTSFSTAKSVTSLLVGIALERGHLASLSDPVTRYVPELTARDQRFARLTLAQLLDMRSGLRWRDHDFITGDKPRAYYEPQLRRLVLEEVGFAEEPGTRWQYNSYNTILLGMVLERATGRSPAALLEAWIWQRLGMEFAASWSVDGPRAPMVKMESGINARAVDFAKLARLVLHDGAFGDERIVSAEWIRESTRFAPDCRLDEARFPAMCYRRAWWLPAPEPEIGAIVAATGHLGQYLYVFPDLELIVVRFGKKPGDVSWPDVMRQIARAVAAANPRQ